MSDYRMGRKRQLKFRSVFISDVHLGFRGCSAEYLLDFLKSIDTERLYLVGDIVDLWSLKKTFYWPQTHNNVIRVILGMAKRGTKVIYIPGNHDSLFREHEGAVFGNLEIHREFIHTTADGRRLLVMHGDEFDGVIKLSSWIDHFGEVAYDFILELSQHVTRIRSRFGLPYWSLASYIKHRVKNAVTFIANFEHTLAMEAKRRGVDGVVCGHIHHGHIRQFDDVLYLNDGDWVESCTALSEDHSGRLSLLRWTDRKEVAAVRGEWTPLFLDDAA